MTKAKPHEAAKNVRTRMRDLIYQEEPDGTTVVKRDPEQESQKPMKGSGDSQERRRKAASYARFAAKAQPIYAKLAEGTAMTAYHLALADWFDPPTIHEVQLRPDEIRIQASDTVMVTRVIVAVRDERGKLLEAGEAIRQGDDWWTYRLRQPGKTLTVEAWDLAGNVAKVVL